MRNEHEQYELRGFMLFKSAAAYMRNLIHGIFSKTVKDKERTSVKDKVFEVIAQIL